MKPENGTETSRQNQKNEVQSLNIKEEGYPMKIPESQGDLADRAEAQIQAELDEQIARARSGLRPAKINPKNSSV